MKILRRFWTWFSRVLYGTRYELQGREDVPERVEPDLIYLIGEGEHEWHLVMGCPCGCGSVIYLNLLPQSRPRWTYEVTCGRISIHPSIWRTEGCRSHFWIREGLLEWASYSDPKI